MSLIPKFYKDAVVSIGLKSADGNISWIGTGFFVSRKVAENQVKPFLVTNKHVLDGCNSIVIRMKEKESDNLKIMDATIKNGNTILYQVHDNPNIDIAVLPLDGAVIMQNNLEFPSFDIDDNALSSAELRASGVDEGTLIYMLGFTMGRVNQASGDPICRLGCVARINEAQIQEEQNILIDIQNFPGNSGSPIINKPEIISIEGTPNLNRSVLVGIIHSYLPYEDTLISTQTKKVVEIRTENSGLAYAHPVEYITEIIDKVVPKM